MVPDRDHWWHELKAEASADCPPEEMDAEDLLFILYTSGTTGKPKGVCPHHGRLQPLHPHDLQNGPLTSKIPDVYWCTADVGWNYRPQLHCLWSPLSNGATSLMYEGVPRPLKSGLFLGRGRKVRVNIFYNRPHSHSGLHQNGDELAQGSGI